MVTKFDIDKFDGKINFAIWKVHMQAVLMHQGYKKDLRGIAHKPQNISDENLLELDEKALAAIQLFLTREVLRENLDVNIDDEDKAVLLVISLPASNKHFKEIMLYGNRETLSFDDVKSALLSKQKYDDDVEPESGEGLVTRSRSSDRGDPDGDVYLAIDTEKSRDELIVDSGCTFYMIPHRSWFTTYESFNGGNVYIGNHSTCPIIGKGTIQVKMHDGVVRTITEVRYFSDLKRNLISLSTLEANGCKYSGEGGVMKIFKGALMLMKAIQSGGLYVLQGTVVYGTAGVTTSKASLDDSKLWHYRLGHMGEKGMKNLAKKGLIQVSCNLKFCEHCVFGKQKRTPQQNDVAERMNMTIMEKVRCMLSHANLDKDFWVEVATTTTYLINRSPYRSLDGNIPEILWSESISSPKCDKRVVAMKEKVKDGISGVESNWYKARYVVRGFDQREGIDFNEVFSPVVRHTSIRVLLSIVALQDLKLEQLDVKTTFLHGHLEEEIYVEQPEGFKVPEKEDHVCRLKKSLYGLKQSPRQWYKRFDSFMIGHGYDRCSYDECVYLRKFPDASFFYSTDYISKVLKKFNMSSCKPVPTPLAPHFKLSSHECPKSKEDKEDTSRVPYSSAADRLMYAMVCTRPDLAHAVSVVSRYMHNPGRASPNGVVGYVDSDYAGDLDARKSISSYIFSHCGSAISWYSSLQAITALSTTEAEYISPTEGVKEAIWLRGMVNEFCLPQKFSLNLSSNIVWTSLALLVFNTLRDATTATMKSYGFWFKVEIVGIVSQEL
nr:retrovirus-related Pol polyprotein from transposon TNT 1-94 [Tanacetum cinerariifolium]